MAKVHLKGFSKKFLELKRNEEGEVMLDKNGFPVKHRVTRTVRYNAAYFPPEVRK